MTTRIYDLLSASSKIAVADYIFSICDYVQIGTDDDGFPVWVLVDTTTGEEVTDSIFLTTNKNQGGHWPPII